MKAICLLVFSLGMAFGMTTAEIYSLKLPFLVAIILYGGCMYAMGGIIWADLFLALRAKKGLNWFIANGQIYKIEPEDKSND